MGRCRIRFLTIPGASATSMNTVSSESGCGIGPLIHGQMPHPLSDDTVFIDVALAPGFTVGVSASIYRIGEDLVECVVGGGHPADRARHAGRHRLQWKRQTFRSEPEPNATRRTEFGKTLENRADGAGNGMIGMKQDLAVLFSPNEAHRQSATQFAACRFVADAAVEPGADDMQLGFTHRALQSEQQAIIEQRRMIDTVGVTY